MPRPIHAAEATPVKPAKATGAVVATAPRLPGRLSVAVMEILAAEVFLDGKRIGVKNVRDLEVPSGPHELLVRNACCEDFRKQIALAPGEVHEEPEIYLVPRAASITVSAKAADPSTTVVLTDATDPTWMRTWRPNEPIRVDMPKRGGRWEYVRTVNIDVRRDGYQMDPIRKSLAAGSVETLTVELAKK